MALGCLPVVHNSGGMKEFVPEQYRYETMKEAAGKVVDAINNWSPDKTEEVTQIASQFSLSNFSRRFMALFNDYHARN